MLKILRKLIPNQSFIRLFYHKIMAFLAASYYGFPGRKLKIIAVTGTHGKTSTVNLISQFLTRLGYRVGMISTIRFQILDQVWTNKSKMTTPGHFELHKILRDMVNARCEYVVMEASSHAMTQSRLFGLNVEIAIMISMAEDHIEYHGSYKAYRAAKRKLFEKTSKGVLVLNAADHEFEFFDTVKANRKIYYGKEGTNLWASDIDIKPDRSIFKLHLDHQSMMATLPLSGRFNIDNALAAASVLYVLNVNFEQIKLCIEHATPVPGRMETVECGQKFTVVVDYAHTQDAIEGLCTFFKPLTLGKLHIVFGATGGGRDKRKRPIMGEIADKYADFIYLTNDDPYEEDQKEIIEQIHSGIKRSEGENLWKIVDRKEAIKKALSLAKDGDTVIIAGKGCEEVIAINGQLLPWSDRGICEEFLGIDRNR